MVRNDEMEPDGEGWRDADRMSAHGNITADELVQIKQTGNTNEENAMGQDQLVMTSQEKVIQNVKGVSGDEEVQDQLQLRELKDHQVKEVSVVKKRFQEQVLESGDSKRQRITEDQQVDNSRLSDTAGKIIGVVNCSYIDSKPVDQRLKLDQVVNNIHGGLDRVIKDEDTKSKEIKGEETQLRTNLNDQENKFNGASIDKLQSNEELMLNEESIVDRDSERERGRERESSYSDTSRDSSGSKLRSKRYICAECGKAYSRPVTLQQHLMTHTGDRPLKCEICLESFIRKDHLKRHMLKHTPEAEKPHHCKVCNKGCNSLQHLRRHEKVHEKSYLCDQCGEAFFKHQTMKHHIKVVHLNHKIVCEFCNKEFSRPYRLANHMARQHNESPGFQCTFPGCFKNFKTFTARNLHLKTDHPKLICTVCGKGCIGTQGLELHIKVHGDSSGQHLTDEPTVRVITPQKLIKLPDNISSEKLHDMVTKNVEERTLPCAYKNCIRLFKRQYDLDRHLKWHAEQDIRLNQKIISITESMSTTVPISPPTSTASEGEFEEFDKRQIACTSANCFRKFKTAADLNKHLTWHKKISH